jgi:hypothetical protein
MRAYRGEGKAPLILNLGAGWKKVVACKERRCPLNMRLGELQSRSGCSGEEKYLEKELCKELSQKQLDRLALYRIRHYLCFSLWAT